MRFVLVAAVALAATGCGGGGNNTSSGGGIAYVTNDGGLWFANADGTERMRLAVPGPGTQPKLAPDGKAVAYVRNSGPTGAVLTVSTSGGRPNVVRRATARIASIAWSPDSTKLVSVDNEHVAVTDVDERTSTVIADLSAGSALSETATFSPDGSKVAYDYYHQGLAEVHDLATHSTRRAAEGGWPLWGTGGLAFRGGPLQQQDIWLVTASGEKPTRLTRTKAGLTPLAWSTDGRRLVAGSLCVRNGAWAVDVPSGGARAITRLCHLLPMGLSRDGSTILACSQERGGTLETVPFEGGEPHDLLEGACYASWNA
jgi:Tol biopolymer transport system component